MGRIADLAIQLETLEAKAGEEGWGGEFREELFDEMIEFLKKQHKHPSIGLLLAHLITVAESDRT